MKITLLSDNDILKITNNKCVTNEGDYNLRFKHLQEIEGGLFDPNVFNKNDRFSLAYYLLSTPVVYPTKLKSLYGFIKKTLTFINLNSNDSYNLKILIFSYYNIKETTEEDYDLIKDNIYYKVEIQTIIDDNVNIEDFDYQNLGLLGLLNLSLYNTKNNSSLKELQDYININILISNPVDRPTTFFTKNKRTVTMLDSITQSYKIVINADKKIKEKLYYEDNSIFEKCLLCLTLNDLVSELILNHQLVGKSSKETIVRSMLSTRIQNSGRTTIVGDPILPIDEVSIPKSLLYNSFKSKIISLIEQNHLNIIGRIEYNKQSTLALKYFDILLKDLVVIINRNPSLHKYNMLAFKATTNDDYVMKLPLLVTKIFGADFDGDTMSFYPIIDENMKELALSTMSAQSNWIYEKYNNFLFTPRHEILYGLNLLTNIVDNNTINNYNNIQNISNDIDNGIISENSAIIYNNIKTCFGRLLINDILQFDIFNDILNNECISPKNITDFMVVINTFENKIEILNDLQNIALKAATLLTNSVLNINELFNLQKSLNYKENIESQIKTNINQDFKKVMDSNDRLKFNSLYDMIVKNNNINNNTLLEGMSEDYYIKHTLNNRILLDVKQKLVPTSGYITRQLASLGMNLIYSDSLNDNPQKIIIEKSWLKTNRIISNNIDDSKIEILSSVFNNSNTIFSNELDNDRFNYFNNHPIGLSLMTSLTEELTQSALSLKHGGKLYFDEKLNININKNLTFEKIDKNIVYFDKNVFYIIPNDFTYEDYIISGNIRNYVDYKLEGFKLLVDLNASRLLNKTYKAITYAPFDGIITYDLTPQKYNKKKVDGLIKINDIVIDFYNKNLVYYYGNNTKVNKYDKISNGIIDLNKFNNLTNNLDTFYIFCKQYYELFNNKVNLELLEILYKLIYKNNFSVKNALKNKQELLDSLAYGNIKVNLNKFLEEINENSSLINKVLL